MRGLTAVSDWQAFSYMYIHVKSRDCTCAHMQLLLLSAQSHIGFNSNIISCLVAECAVIFLPSSAKYKTIKMHKNSTGQRRDVKMTGLEQDANCGLLHNSWTCSFTTPHLLYKGHTTTCTGIEQLNWM